MIVLEQTKDLLILKDYYYDNYDDIKYKAVEWIIKELRYPYPDIIKSYWYWVPDLGRGARNVNWALPLGLFYKMTGGKIAPSIVHNSFNTSIYTLIHHWENKESILAWRIL